MTNERYWRERQLERERYWQEQAGKDLRGEIKRYYEVALEGIKRDVESLYGRYAKENKLTMAEARRLLKGEEYRIWRKTLQEYVKAAAKDSGIQRELNTLAMRSRINRLESLEAQTLMELSELASKLEDKVTETLTRAYLENYYGNLYDIQKRVGLGSPPVAVDRKRIEAVLLTPWSGKNYSERIWRNTRALGLALKDTVVSAIHRGSTIQKLSTDISQRLGVGYSNAERLVRTEMNYVLNKAAGDAIQGAEIEHYKFVAVLDRRTTVRCQSLDGQVFAVEDMQQGENAPPMHVRCRSTIVASFDESNSRGTRVARDGAGRNVRIPGEMKYAEWKQVYIDKTQTLKEWQERRLQNEKIDTQRISPRRLPEREYNLTIRRQVQNRHILGTKEYQQYEEALRAKGLKPSILKEGENAAELVHQFHGRGTYDPNILDDSPREIVNAGRIIGKYWDRKEQKYIDTKFFEMVYSRHGTHIYPVYQFEG